jgi:ankyrin repeat protein
VRGGGHESPLQAVINNSDKDIVQLLLLAGAVVDERYRGYERAIKRAICRADVVMVRILLPHYALNANGRQRLNKKCRVVEMEIRSLEKEKTFMDRV